MPVSLLKFNQGSLPLRRWLTGALLLVCLSTSLPADDDDNEDRSGDSARSSSSREDSDDGESDSDDEADDRRTPRRRRKRTRRSNERSYRKPDDSRGVDGQVGFSAFKTFGRDASIGYFELMPYVMADDHMLIGDVRGFVDLDGQFGGNFGLGYRFWQEDWKQMFGGSLWYDADQLSGELFHQLGLSLETRAERWDARTNLYLPVFDTEENTGSSVSGLRYSNDNILFDYRRDSLVAMQGMDAEAGVLLPSRFSRRHDLRVYGGLYRFTGDGVDDINGWKSRFQGHITDSVSASMEFTSDDTYGSTVMLNAAFEFSGGVQKNGTRTPLRSQLMRQFTRRNFNIIVGERTEIRSGLTAINPATGLPWRVAHVSTTGGSGTGNVNTPFDNIADAQAANRDLIFVHADSVFNTAVVLQPDDVLLGEGALHSLALSGYGTHYLPWATGGTAMPLLQGITGDAVTLASGSVFAGFTIDSPTGNGIVGTNVNGAVLRNIDIQSASGAGIDLTGSTGSWLMSSINIDEATGTGLHIDGGSASMVLTGELTNTTGRAVLIENTTGGTIGLRGMSITDTGGEGLLLDSNAGEVDFGSVTSTNSTGSGITVTGNTGNVDFFGNTKVENAAGTAVDIQNNPGKVGFADVDLDSDGQTALFVRDSGEVIIESGDINAINSGAAADIEGGPVDIVLNSVSANGGAFGIRLVDTPGRFVIFGDGSNTAGSGGLIQNMTTAGVLAENAGVVALQYVDLDSNNIGVQATDTYRVVLQSSRVTDSTSFGTDLLDVEHLEIIGSVLTGNGDSAVRARFQTVNDYTYEIRSSLFEQPTGHAIDIVTEAGAAGSDLALVVTRSEINIEGTGASGVNLSWNGGLSTTFTKNEFNGNGGSNTGIAIEALSTTETASIGMGANVFEFTGGADTAISITTAGKSSILLESNAVLFDDPGGIGAAGGTGFNFDLASQASVSLLNNLIIDNDSSGTGILFTSIGGPSTVALNGNQIRLLSTDLNVDRGIVFSAVPAPITLSGITNNIITGATDTFLGTGNVGGSFILNGSLFSP